MKERIEDSREEGWEEKEEISFPFNKSITCSQAAKI